jgi:3'(2'), 5'-bisphosphate nucleotidase
MQTLTELVFHVRDLASRAGELIMRFYHNDTNVTFKADTTPLTAADTASHEFLVKALQSLLPNVAVISEESDGFMNCSTQLSKSFWLVDPLDGTKEFVKRTNEFTVNVALVDDGSPILGVVHAPALSLTYYGGREFGAWRQVGDEPPKPISTRVASSSQLGVVASKDHAGPLVSALLARLTNPQLRSMGSSLKFCLVAEGKADLYLRDLPTMEWDTAAAQCVVEAAGGGVYSLNGEQLRYCKPGLKNPAIVTVGDTRFGWQALISDL